MARVDGSKGEHYKVTLNVMPSGKIVGFCDCYVDGECKHLWAMVMETVDWFKEHPGIKFTQQDRYREKVFQMTPAEMVETIMQLKYPKSYAVNVDSSQDEESESDRLPCGLVSLSMARISSPEMDFIGGDLIKVSISSVFNQQIQVGILPATLRCLYLGDTFNMPLIPGSLPVGLETLEFGNNFNQPLELGVLPSTLRYLKVGQKFNQPIHPRALPEGLVHFKYNSIFNIKVEKESFPASLSRLSFSWIIGLESVIKAIPMTLFDLDLGDVYDHPLKGTLPPSLRTLSLGRSFSKPILSQDLPDTLTTSSLNGTEGNSY
eukprot:gene10759-12529_t